MRAKKGPKRGGQAQRVGGALAGGAVLVGLLLASGRGSKGQGAPRLAAGTPDAVAPAAPRTSAPTRTLTGAIRAEPSSSEEPKGRLVVAWLSPEEVQAWKAGRTDAKTFRALVERFRVSGEIDLGSGSGASYRVEAPAGASALVVVDVGSSFWRTLFGGGEGLVGIGPPDGGDVTVAPNLKPTAVAEPCAGERMRLLLVDSPEVAGAVGNPTQRRFCAYLPPSYESAPSRRYPVVFLFGGFMSNEMVRFRGKPSAKEIADAVARETGREAILIGVDASTKTGSTYLEDSPTTGRWASFMSGAALEAVDGQLRTLATREGRALVGQSTGGFIAISFGMRHPELFGAVAATAPDALDLDTWIFGVPGQIKPWVLAWTRLEASLGGPGQMTSYAADWSPRPDGGYDWPFDLDTGRPTAALARWVARSPSRMLDDPAVVSEVRRRLSGKILVAIAEQDEFDLSGPARVFAAKLRERGIEHELDETAPGHLDGGPARTEKAIRFVMARLQDASHGVVQ